MENTLTVNVKEEVKEVKQEVKQEHTMYFDYVDFWGGFHRFTSIEELREFQIKEAEALKEP